MLASQLAIGAFHTRTIAVSLKNRQLHLQKCKYCLVEFLVFTKSGSRASYCSRSLSYEVVLRVAENRLRIIHYHFFRVEK